MKSLGTIGRSRSKWMGLAAACMMAATLAPSAHAQGGTKLGAVLGVPIQGLGSIIAANAVQNNVNVLHISQAAFGGLNNQIATVAISQKNSAGPSSSPGLVACKIPKIWLPQVQQINLNRVVVNQTAVGNGNTQVADVQVAQSNASAKPGGRYLLVPGNLVGPLLQLNINIVVVTQVAVGNGNTQVAVLQVDQSNGGNINVPSSAANSLVQINSNIKVITQVAVGDFNTQVATLNVGQANG